MMYVLEQITTFGDNLFMDHSFLLWYQEKRKHIIDDFDKVYDEVNEFVKDNKDIILLLFTSLNQCHGGISSETEEAIQNF